MNTIIPIDNNVVTLKKKAGRKRIRPIDPIELAEYNREHYNRNKELVDKEQYFLPEQIESMMRVARNNKERMLIFIADRTGKRVSEIITLQYGDIKWDMNLIEFNILKKKERTPGTKNKWRTKKERRKKTYPLEIFEQLWKYTHEPGYINSKGKKRYTYDPKIDKLLFKDKEWLFPATRNTTQHIRRQTVDRIIKRIAKNAGITIVGSKRPHFHLFRHTALAQRAELADNPKDIAKLKEFADHSRTDTTIAYLTFNTKEFIDKEEEVYKKFPLSNPIRGDDDEDEK